MWKTLLIAVIAAASVLVYLSIDESPSRSANGLASTASPDSLGPSNAYRILLGMQAAEEDDAYDVGSRLIDDFVQASENASVLENFSFSQYPEDKKLYVPSSDDDDLYCLIRDSGCLDTIAIDRSGRDEEVRRLRKLVDRYSAYLAANDYRTEAQHFVAEPLQEYRYVFVASRMNIFTAFSAADDGDVDGAIESLLEESRLLRTKLEVSDTLIHKLITLAMLRDNFETVAYIHSTYEAHAMVPIHPLDSSELSFEKPLQNEFALMSEIAAELGSDPDYLSENSSVPAWFVGLTYRPNVLANNIAERLQKQIALSQVGQAEFSAAVKKLDLTSGRIYSMVPNVQNYLANFADVDYTHFIARAFDLNAKISLMNAQIAGNPNSLENPYYPGEDVELYEDDLAICMTGPLPDERRFRCLDIGVHEQLVSTIIE